MQAEPDGNGAVTPAPGALGKVQALPKPCKGGYADVAAAPDATRAAITHSACVEWLQKMPDRLQEGGTSGWTRRNYLGDDLANGTAWPELKAAGLAPVAILGADSASHAVVRPFLDEALGDGAWVAADITAAAAAALPTDTQRIEPMDIDQFTATLLFKQHFGMDIDRTFAEDFRKLQRGMLVSALSPSFLVTGPLRFITARVLGLLAGVDVAGMPRRRAKLLPKLSAALKAKFGERYNQLSTDQQKLVVSGFLDSMVFAGGQMVPTLIKSALATLYSADSKARTVPPGGVKLSEDNADAFALEMVRFVPQAFQVNAINPAPKPGKAEHEAAVVAAAGFDKTVWSEDAFSFSLSRADADYERLSVAFAEPAKCPHSAKDSRNCPAKSLALAMLTAYLKRFAVVSGAAGSGGDAAAAWECSVAPDKLDLGESFVTSDVFTLTRLSAPS